MSQTLIGRTAWCSMTELQRALADLAAAIDELGSFVADYLWVLIGYIVAAVLIVVGLSIATGY